MSIIRKYKNSKADDKNQNWNFFIKMNFLKYLHNVKYKNTNLDDITRGRSRDARKVRIPKDMSGLFKMTGDK